MLLTMFASAVIASAQGTPVQKAVLWERAKDTAAQRTVHTTQAPTQPAPEAKPGDGTVDEAVRWERAKDNAAKRQAQQDASASESRKKR
jgi:uncharacterized cupredoxin-like copper-binding protein